MDTALKWIESYLPQCTQKVVLNNQETSTTIESGTTTLKQGVPQGSILEPILFNLFVAPLGELCRVHGVSFQGYADDT